MKIIPITLKEANEFVVAHHRHHDSVQGCRFAIGLNNDSGQLVGVAICGRPLSRHYDNGLTLEINRLCTDGTHNACSRLYGVCCRIAKDMGYEKIITYILESESGNSLKASNFVCEGIAGGTHWTGERYANEQQSLFEKKKPAEMKTRWVKKLRRVESE